MAGSKITAKGQTTIPKEVRDALGLRPGDRVLFVRKGDDVVLVPARGSLLDLRGAVRPRERPEDFDHIRRTVRRARAQG